MGLDTVDRLKMDYDIEVEWRPFFLHPEFPPEGKPVEGPPSPDKKMVREHLKQLADEAGLPLVSASIVPNSQLTFEAAEFARAKGKFDDFHRSLFRAYFSDGRNIGDKAVLTSLGAWVGLDPEELQEALESGRYVGSVKDQVDAAHSFGITAVPTFLIGRRAVIGAQPYEVFQLVMSSVINS